MSRIVKGLMAALLAGLMAAAAAGAKGPEAPRLAKISTDQKININNVSVYVSNEGSFSFNIGAGAAGLEFPKGTGKTAVFASGLWVGGKVSGDLRVATGEYQFEWRPGPMGKDGKPADANDAKYKVYKISAGDGPSNPDYANWPVADGAPVGKDGKPLILGDQTLWSIYNDADESKHTHFQTKALGLEVQQTLFAFDRPGALGNTIFIKFKIINKGGNKIDSTYVSLWSDPDLGQADNDLVGCDVGLSLGYVYNATNTDAIYGSAPPAVGFDFFKGPLGPDKKPLPMTSFNKYINGTDPRTAQQVYSYMQGKDAEGKDVIDPTTGKASVFVVPGDPVTGAGWLDTNPADRRLMMTSGPFTMAPGDTQEVVAGLVVGQGKDRLTSITALKFFDSFAQAAFDADFQLPSPPAAPKVTVTPLDGKVVLTWDDASEKGGDPRYAFEGYNVYQGESVAGPWKRIATYDVVNGAAIIFDNDFDQSAGVVIYRPAEFGGDTGIKHFIELKEDAIKGGKLISGQTYFFAVTAYSYGANQSPKTLETSIAPLRDGRLQRKPLSEEFEPANGIIPRWPTAGSDFKVVKTDSAVTHKSGVSDGQVFVKIVNPGKITGSAYQVKFKTDKDGNLLWDLVDATKNTAVLKDMAQNASEAQGDANPLVDGLLVKVLGPPNGMKEWSIPSGARWLTWAGADGFGAEGFNGAITGDPNSYWFGPSSTTPDKLRTVELRFTSVVEAEGEDQYKPVDLKNANVSYGYRYLRGAGNPAPAPASETSTKNPYDWSKYIVNKSGPGTYVYQDRRPICLAAYDVEAKPPRRLEVGFLENNVAGGLVNGAYGPPFNTINNISVTREFLFVFDLPYTDPAKGENSKVLTDNGLITPTPTLPIMWIVFANRRQEARFPKDGDVLLMTANHVNTTADVFEFKTTGPVIDDNSLAQKREDLKAIRVVPNPYYGQSAYELSQLSRVVRFTHLPKQCMIKVFSLGGDLVRSFNHTDGTSIESWDLKNDFGLPVASGVYLAFIEAPGIGKQVVKIAIFMEAERLDNF